MPVTTTNKDTAPAALPASAPTSPLFMRTAKKSGGNALPVTPIRPPRARVHAAVTMPRHVSGQHARSTSGHWAPATPTSNGSSPHTPALSNLSIASSDTSAIITPSKDGHAVGTTGPLIASPDVVKKKLPSTADEVVNWRSRASQNGIKVSSTTEIGDDDDNDSSYNSPTKLTARPMNLDTAPLPAPFLSTHRRTRSTIQQTQNTSIKTASQAPTTPDRRSLSTTATLNTPPPKANILDKLKAKGIATEPPQPRRRPAPTELFDISEDDYSPYPHSFTGAKPPLRSASFNDPFNVSLTSIAESTSPFIEDNSIDLTNLDLPIASDQRAQRTPTAQCSVCDATVSRIAVLEPCRHQACSACLTSSLNIVGEKEMKCATCNMGVQDFKLQVVEIPNSSDAMPATSTPPLGRKDRVPLLPSLFDNAANDPFAFFEQPQSVSTPAGRGSRVGENIVLRVDNVPWDITPPTMAAWIKQPVELVHVLLDRKGKTLSHAYVELANDDIAKAALRGVQNAILGKGKRARGVTVTRSSQEELMRALFPSWQGGFDGSRPSLHGLPNERVIAALEAGLITETELNALLHLIRSPDSHFLKVPSLPFHSLISILAKFPCDTDARVCWSTALRDSLFEVTSAAIQVMLPRVKEKQTAENMDLVMQLLNAAMSCQAFTTEQVAYIVELAQHAPSVLRPHNGAPAPEAANFSRAPAVPPTQPQMLPRIAPQQIHMPIVPPGITLGMRIPSGGIPSAPTHQIYRPPQMQHVAMQMPMAQPYVQLPMHAMFSPAPPPPSAMPQTMQGIAPSSYDALAREFGVDPGLLEVLAQRLSNMR